jgi:hypothetical protein
MIFKYNFSVSGNNFYPDKVLKKLKGNFLIGSYFQPNDMKFEDNFEVYGYGSISFWHPKKFSSEEKINDYENEFILFIEENFSTFVENGVEDLQIFIEIYFDGGQCNFEIFNKELLKRLGLFGVSLPISIYTLKEEEINEWRREIKQTWEIN